MAKFDFNDKEDVKKLNEELNNIFESKIQKLELESALNSLSTQPFGAIKNVFEGITDKLYESAAGKKIIAKYVKSIREGKGVSNAYSIYEFVYNSPNVTNPEKFLTEALEMTSDYIEEGNFNNEKKKVAEVVAEAVKFAGKNAQYVEERINENFAINEAIDYLMLNPKSLKNLDEYVNRFDFVEKHLEENMNEKVSDDAKKTGKELIDGLNESLEGLADWEKLAISDIAIARLAKRDMSELFEEYKNKCLEKLSENIEKEPTVELKSHFETMKKQLEEKKYNEGSLYEDIVTLADLRSKLSE
jgi:hypothetical protein